MRIYLTKAFLVAMFAAVASFAAVADDKMEQSGYLGDASIYAKLEKVELGDDEKGTAKRWIGPNLNASNFESVLVDEVTLYPEPEPGPQVSAETLGQISDYLTQRLREKVAAKVKTTDTAGPGVLKIEAAVTGVAVKTEGMKAYEVVPVAAIFGAAKAATGTRDRNVKVFIEVRMSDSQSGELVGAVVRQLVGKDLKGKKDQLELEDVKGSLEKMTDDAAEGITETL